MALDFGTPTNSTKNKKKPTNEAHYYNPSSHSSSSSSSSSSYSSPSSYSPSASKLYGDSYAGVSSPSPVHSRVSSIQPVDSRIDELYETRNEGLRLLLEDIRKDDVKPAAAAAVGKRIVAIDKSSPVFDKSQLTNAATIAKVGRQMDMSKRDIMIGLMTAMQESTLHNYDYGDRDSLGLFQQRPSMGWGTPEQVTTPEYAARKFFEGLKGVTDRNNMAPTYAAQAVQRSAYPDAYAKWEDEARSIMRMRGGNPHPFLHGLNNLKMPVQGATLADMTSDFGPRIHPITGRSSFHTGADLSAAMGTPVYSPTNAIIEELNRGDSIYGNQAILSHGRDIETMYGHMAGFGDLDVGQKIRKGDVIGYVGSTGLSTGPHLHWETWLNSKPVNPIGFVEGDYGKVKGQFAKSSPAYKGPAGSSGASISPSGSSMSSISYGSGSSGSSGSSGFSGLSGGSAVPPFIASLMPTDGRDFRGLDMAPIIELLSGPPTQSSAPAQEEVLSFLMQLLAQNGVAA